MATLGIIDIVNNTVELSLTEATVSELRVMQFGIGAKGDTGLSAYEVAVENGFEGTEQEWLDSLHGGILTDETLTELTGILKGKDGKLAQAVSGTDYVAPSAINDMITGAGNNNFIPMFLGGSRIITDSGIKYLNGKVGIGIGTPLETLHIDGAFRQSFVKSAALASDSNGKLVSLGYTPENQDNKGAAYGYCELDGSDKVPANRMISSLLKYQSVWNAEDNIPELSEVDTSKKGYAYTVSVPFTRFGIDWELGDWLIYNDSGTIEKSDNSDNVLSVNGQTGIVVLDADDISDASTTNKFVTSTQRSNIHASGSDAETATSIGSLINSATAKDTPVDADMLGLMDSEATNLLKKFSWANVKAKLKDYFDTIYAAAAHTHSYLTDLVNDTTPQLGGNLDLNGKCIDYGAILSTNGAYQGDIKTVTVDTNGVGFGALLAQGSDFNYDEADADAVANCQGLVMALETGTGSKKVLLKGEICNTDWNWSAGFIYASTTQGTLTQTQPSGTDDVIVRIGWALSADTIWFNPSYVTVTHT